MDQTIDRPKHEVGTPGRIRTLSIAELALSYWAVATLFVFGLVSDRGVDLAPMDRAFHTMTSSGFLSAFVWAILNSFSMLLMKRTLLVNVLVNPFRQSSAEVGRPADDAKLREDALASLRAAMKLARETAGDEGSSAPATNAVLDAVQDTFSGMEFDAVELEFRQYLFRSGAAASTAQRRPNALLFIGTIIALVGLIFFFVTLPGAGRFSAVLPTGTGQVSATPEDFWSSGLQLLPRLVMLVFIQVLAGFFLRQYRASVEDFRYYESILRHREAQYLSYVLRKKTDDKKSLVSFAREIMEDRPLGILTERETTTTLEAKRIERSELSSFYEAVELAKQRKALKKKDDEDHSSE
jgi:hypothetical protein